MKKVFAIVLAMMLCFGLLSVGAVAADNSYTVHMDVSDVGWDSLYVYFWGAGTCAGWPGELVTEKDSDGWYVFQIPVGAQGLVLSNGAGTQTIDLNSNNGMLLDQECWIVVKTDTEGGKHKFGCSASKPAAGEEIKPVDPTAPAIEYMEVVGSGLPGISWNPGASVRMENSAANVFTATFTAVPAGEYAIKFAANGNWNDYNFGGSFAAFGVATEAAWNSGDIAITVSETCDLTVTLDLTAFDYSSKSGAKFTVGASTAQGGSTPDVGSIKIHVIAPQSWTAVYAYTYNAELCGAWPGVRVENGAFEVPATFEGLVLNNGEGQQTMDIKDIDLTKAEVWITLGAAGEDGKLTYSLSYTAPEVDPAPVGPNVPTGDHILSVTMLLMLSVAGLVTLCTKKENG